MNFIQLVARVAMECGVTPPTTTISQTDESLRLVSWTNTAWMDIQSAHRDWQWMRKSASFITVAGQVSYSPTTDILLTDFGMWSRDTFRNYVTSVGTNSEIFMNYLDYEEFRNRYLYGALRNTRSRPVEMTITPDKSIAVGPVPIDGYTVTGDYFSVPSEMALDADIPVLPSQFHMAIVYKAMMFYGGFEAATEVYQRGNEEFLKIMRRLTADRLPEIVQCGALA